MAACGAAAGFFCFRFPFSVFRFFFPRVGDVKNRGARGAVGFEQRQHAGLGDVGDAFAGDGDGVGHAHRRVGGVGDFGERIGFLRGGRVGVGGAEREGRSEEQGGENDFHRHDGCNWTELNGFAFTRHGKF